jgi:hypothetical protein
LGYVTITHPFHPLRGERLKVLSSKSFNSRDILSLQNLSGRIVSIPREWTDKADPHPYHSLTSPLPILSFTHLQQLAELIPILQHARSVRSKKLKD